MSKGHFTLKGFRCKVCTGQALTGRLGRDVEQKTHKNNHLLCLGFMLVTTTGTEQDEDGTSQIPSTSVIKPKKYISRCSVGRTESRRALSSIV